MSRYIDADALKNTITDLDGGCAIEGTGFDIYTCEVFELIDEQPTADVCEVVHGEWTLNDLNGFKIYDCSNCGIHIEAQFNYCPNCGADMRCEK